MEVNIGGYEEKKELDDRLLILSEENQLLFQQLQLYKVCSYYRMCIIYLKNESDAVLQLHDQRTKEAEAKISQYDKIYNAYQNTLTMNEELLKQKQYLENKIKAFSEEVR
jgi:hypothetical protein